MRKFFVVCLTFLLIYPLANSQTVLFFGYPGKNRKSFFIGDEIEVITSDRERISGRINYLAPGKIGLDGAIIDIHSVKKVVFPDKYLWFRSTGIGLLVSTPFLLGLDILTRKINTDQPAFDGRNTGVTITLMSLGVVLVPWKDQKKRVKPSRPLKVVVFD